MLRNGFPLGESSSTFYDLEWQDRGRLTTTSFLTGIGVSCYGGGEKIPKRHNLRLSELTDVFTGGMNEGCTTLRTGSAEMDIIELCYRTCPHLISLGTFGEEHRASEYHGLGPIPDFAHHLVPIPSYKDVRLVLKTDRFSGRGEGGSPVKLAVKVACKVMDYDTGDL